MANSEDVVTALGQSWSILAARSLEPELRSNGGETTVRVEVMAPGGRALVTCHLDLDSRDGATTTWALDITLPTEDSGWLVERSLTRWVADVSDLGQGGEIIDDLPTVEFSDSASLVVALPALTRELELLRMPVDPTPE